MTTAIETTELTKHYDDTVAVRDLSLAIEEGEVYGLVGPNGAGKSTTIDMLMDYTPPTSGTATIFGHDTRTESVAVHREVGILPDRFGLYDRLTGRRHVQYILDSKSAAADPDTLLDRVGLTEAASRNVGGYSKGMQQRLALAMALAGDPSVLILDEPFTGLDPHGVRLVRKVVREEAARDTSVLFSSHVLGQVELLCDRIGLLSDGALIAEGEIATLRRQANAGYLFLVTIDEEAKPLAEPVRRINGVSTVIREGQVLRVICADRDLKPTIVDTIEKQDVAVSECIGERASLEDVFVAYTGNS